MRTLAKACAQNPDDDDTAPENLYNDYIKSWKKAGICKLTQAVQDQPLTLASGAKPM